MSGIYLHTLSAALGEGSRTVEETAAAGLTVSTAKALREAGFGHHRVAAAGTTALDLAVRAAAPVAAEAAAVVGEGALPVLYVTCLPESTFVDDVGADPADVKGRMRFTASHLATRLGLENAEPMGLHQQACTGLLGAVRVGRALLVAEDDVQGVLCVTADRFPEGARYEQALNLISDGASSFLLSRQPRGYRVLACAQRTRAGLLDADDDQTAAAYFAETHAVVQGVVARGGRRLDEVSYVVPQNINNRAWPVLARLLRIDPERVAMPTREAVGHVIASDNVLNLAALEAERRVKPGDLVVLVMAGFGLHWQAVLLERTGVAP